MFIYIYFSIYIIQYIIYRKLVSKFYLLPKIQKRRWNVSGHPVIPGNGTATENISLFLNFHLKTIIWTIPHILEDTRDILSRLNQVRDIPDNTLLVTFDVVGLYPHLPREKGLGTMKIYIDKRECQSMSSGSLYKLAKIILKYNYFELRQDEYHQILGTAIGVIFAPHYAIIFMAGLEQETQNFNHCYGYVIWITLVCRLIPLRN